MWYDRKIISGDDNGSASIVQNFVSCIVGYNSKPIWWNDVITDKNKNEWFDVEYADENFLEYDETFDEESFDDIMYNDNSQLENSDRIYEKGKLLNSVYKHYKFIIAYSTKYL